MSDQPLCERSEPHRSSLDQDGKEPEVGLSHQKLRGDSQRMLVRAPHAEHPAIALASSNRAAHLIGQRLERDLFVRSRQGARNRAAGPVARHRVQKLGDRLLVAPVHQVREAGKRDQPRAADRLVFLNLDIGKARAGKATRARARTGFRGCGETPRARGRPRASRPDPPARQLSRRAIPDRGIGSDDRLDEHPADLRHVGRSVSSVCQWSAFDCRCSAVIAGTFCSTRTIDSSNSARIRSRSTPASASATWASTTPNLTPRL